MDNYKSRRRIYVKIIYIYSGGGKYSDFGTKMGKWIDLDVRVGGGCSM